MMYSRKSAARNRDVRRLAWACVARALGAQVSDQVKKPGDKAGLLLGIARFGRGWLGRRQMIGGFGDAHGTLGLKVKRDSAGHPLEQDAGVDTAKAKAVGKGVFD